MPAILNFFLARLVEPSTWAGFGLIASGLHSGDVAGVASVIAGMVAAAMKEGESAPSS